MLLKLIRDGENNLKQVDKDHYSLSEYMIRKRWISVWHQLDEVFAFVPDSVLEVGPGTGIFKAAGNKFGINVETVDIDPELNPNILASVSNIPLTDNSYDVCCAFQVIEHLPYEEALLALGELARIARKGVVISLPDALKCYSCAIYFPIRPGFFHFFIPRYFRLKEHRFAGEHYWEVNKRGYSLKTVLQDFRRISNICYY